MNRYAQSTGGDLEEYENGPWVRHDEARQAFTETILCTALNRLIWKCPLPAQIAAHGPDEALHVWAEYWLAELRDGPHAQRIANIEWDSTHAEFRPKAVTSVS